MVVINNNVSQTELISKRDIKEAKYVVVRKSNHSVLGKILGLGFGTDGILWVRYTIVFITGQPRRKTDSVKNERVNSQRNEQYRYSGPNKTFWRTEFLTEREGKDFENLYYARKL